MPQTPLLISSSPLSLFPTPTLTCSHSFPHIILFRIKLGDLQVKKCKIMGSKAVS